AKVLACHYLSELTVLHVEEPQATDFGGWEGTGVMAAQLVQKRREHELNRLESFMADGLNELRPKKVVLQGDPAKTIVSYAPSEHIDLIVMPTHGYGPFRRSILGSVTAKVLHDADCPVFTGAHMEQATPIVARTFQNILCGIDLGPQS